MKQKILWWWAIASQKSVFLIKSHFIFASRFSQEEVNTVFPPVFSLSYKITWKPRENCLVSFFLCFSVSLFVFWRKRVGGWAGRTASATQRPQRNVPPLHCQLTAKIEQNVQTQCPANHFRALTSTQTLPLDSNCCSTFSRWFMYFGWIM